ncbi:MAG: 50S ribosomal protein L13 [Verrucomicrobiota bacterium]|nr:50S ribosomal protein L13 [Verrucomicrobiota bacterium]
MKTTLAKPGQIEPKWYVVDAEGKVLGRIAVKIANILRGRHKPTYTPQTVTGDFVVVINADKVVLTGKKETQKSYMFYAGFIGREKHLGVPYFRQKRPAFIIEHAVKGMLPKNRISSRLVTRLKVYGGNEHPHAAQNPEQIKL